MTTLFIGSLRTPLAKGPGAVSGGNSGSIFSYQTAEHNRILVHCPTALLFSNQKGCTENRYGDRLDDVFGCPYHRRSDNCIQGPTIAASVAPTFLEHGIVRCAFPEPPT